MCAPKSCFESNIFIGKISITECHLCTDFQCFSYTFVGGQARGIKSKTNSCDRFFKNILFCFFYKAVCNKHNMLKS